MGDKEKKTKKSKRTPEQKRRSGAIAIVTCLSIVVAISIIFSAFSAASQVSVSKLIDRPYKQVAYAADRLVPTMEQNEDGYSYYKFTLPNKDRKFKVLQLTDVHIGGGFASSQTDIWAMNACATMITVEKPDLVIVTGDIAYPVPFQAGTFNNLNATKIFSEFMSKLGVYWTFTFGNHDTEVYGTHTREDIQEYYKNFCKDNPFCLFNPVKGTTGFSDQLIKVGYEQGDDFITTQALICLDSHSYHEDDKLGILWHYDSLHDDQQAWFNKQMDELNAANKKIDANLAPVHGSLFIHIPLEEYREAYTLSNKLNDYTPNELYEKKDNDGKVVSTVQIESGIIGEKDPYCYSGTYGCNTFENCAPHGLKAVFCGHDHYNNIVMNYSKKANDETVKEKCYVKADGMYSVKLCYGRSIDYLAYPGIWQWQAQRGCNVITLVGNDITVENQDYYAKKYETVRNDIGADKADKYSKKVDTIPDKTITDREQNK